MDSLQQRFVMRPDGRLRIVHDVIGPRNALDAAPETKPIMCQAGEQEFAQFYASWILFGLLYPGGLLNPPVALVPGPTARLSTAPRMTVTSGVSFQQHPRQFSDAPISTASIVIMARLLSTGRHRLRIIVTEQCRGFENTAILRAHSRHRTKHPAGGARSSSRDSQHGFRSSRQ